MPRPTGTIYLLHNVILSNTYEHTVDFSNREEQYAYFMGHVKKTFDNYTYIRKEREYVAVDMPISMAEDVNYLIFRSTEDERLYYAFAGSKRYVNDNLTEITYEVDVLQTYMFDYTWKPSYIRQAHVDRWTAEHKPIYSKTDEGLAYGTEYSVEKGYKITQGDNVRWLLVSVKNFDAIKVDADTVPAPRHGTISPAPSPFAQFLVPMALKTTSVGNAFNIWVRYNTDITATPVEVCDYNELLAAMADGTVGPYIQSITLLPYNPFGGGSSVGGDGEDIYVTLDSAAVYTTVKLKYDEDKTTRPIIIPYIVPQDLVMGGQTLARADWDLGLEDSLPTAEQWAEIKEKPYTTPRDKRFESKLLCAPYRYNLLTDWRNPPVIYKNEYMVDDKIEVKYSYALSHNAPFRYWIKDYKKDSKGRMTTLAQSIGLEFPVISDAYYTYMLQNKNTIQTNISNSIISAASSVITGTAHGASSGGAGGAAAGAVGGVLNAAVSIGNQIRSENAKQADLKAVPDSVISGVDSSFNVLDDNTEVNFYRMRICCENEEILAEIFAMSGYKVNRVAVPDLRSRTRYNYIQTLGANIVGSFSQTDLAKIKSIYDNGVTIWHYRATDFNPMDYTYENIEVNLL